MQWVAPALRRGTFCQLGDNFDSKIPSRHGPRVVDVMEALAEAMYPEQFYGSAAPGIFRRVELGNRPLSPRGEPTAR